MVRAYSFRPLSADTWDDFERLFGPRGASGGCWCMLYRVPRAAWEAGKGDGNRAAMQALVDSGAPPGILAYDGEEAVGWCSIAPRAVFAGLGRTRVMKPLDDEPAWLVTCFFIRASHRRQGLSVALLEAACEHVRAQGGRVIEGFPTEPKGGHMAAAFAWTGLAATFRAAGFTEVERRSATRPAMRRRLDVG
jgi:GNAT superfamily N-acetyltransferase